MISTWNYLKASLIMTNPCRKCLIQAACSELCDKRIKYNQLFEDVGRVWYFIVVITLLIAMLVLLGGISAHIVQFIYK